MKYLKMLGLAAIAAGALMAFAGAGTASATELTCSSGVMCAAKTAIHAELENGVTNPATLHPPIGDIKCEESTVAGETTNTGSSTETVDGPISILTFKKCNAEVNVLKAGELIVHTTETKDNNDGTLTSTGAEVTVTFSGFHCIFGTSATSIGWLTGSSTTKATATLDIKAEIPRIGGRSGAFCGSKAEWTGSYSVDTPMFLDVH